VKGREEGNKEGKGKEGRKGESVHPHKFSQVSTYGLQYGI